MPTPLLILLSPAKSLDFETPAPTKTAGVPRFLEAQTAELAGVLKRKKPADLADLMDISDRLAQLNHKRNRRFDASRIHGAAGSRVAAKPAAKRGAPRADDDIPELTPKQALWAFTGDVYQGFDAPSLPGRLVRRAQARVRMLSGLYGVLKPCDLILPYRLEMGTKLKTKKGKDLYEFWGSAVTEVLAEEQPGWVCNLASKEYYSVVSEDELPCPVVHPVFQDETKGQFRVVALFAKYARGLLARWIVDHDARKPGDLAGFDTGGYEYCDAESTDLRPVFRRPLSART